MLVLFVGKDKMMPAENILSIICVLSFLIGKTLTLLFDDKFCLSMILWLNLELHIVLVMAT